MLQDLGLDPDKITPDIRGLDREAGEVPPVPDRGDLGLVHHLKDVGDELAFHLAPGLGVEIGHLDEVIFLQDLLGDPETLGVQAHCRDAAAFAVAPVVHLDGGEKEVFAGHRYAGGKTRDAAAAFVFALDDLVDGVVRGKSYGFPTISRGGGDLSYGPCKSPNMVQITYQPRRALLSNKGWRAPWPWHHPGWAARS